MNRRRNMINKTYLVTRFQNKLNRAQSEVADFVGKVQHDAAYVLSWSNSVFQAAAKERVYKQLIAFVMDEAEDISDLFNEDINVDNLFSFVTDRVLHKAKYPAQSTSPTSNLIEQYELAAWAEVLSDLLQMREVAN